MYSEYHLEDIVVSLALARKLKELNIKYPTPFYWRVWDDGYSDCVIGEYDYEKYHSRIKEEVPTYTSTQLIEKMPHSITFLGDYFYFSISKNASGYEVSYKSEIGEVGRRDRRLEDALAGMHLWLFETNIEVGIIK